jgi:hypothetical protein
MYGWCILVGPTVPGPGPRLSCTRSPACTVNGRVSPRAAAGRLVAAAPPAVSMSNTDQIPTGVKFATAGLGGMAAWCVVHPFNTLAVRMNLASQAPDYKQMSFAQFTARTVREKGIASVYDGLTAGLTRQIFYATSRFGLFEVYRDAIAGALADDEVTPTVRLLAGLSSGACAGVCADVARLRACYTIPAHWSALHRRNRHVAD